MLHEWIASIGTVVMSIAAIVGAVMQIVTYFNTKK